MYWSNQMKIYGFKSATVKEVIEESFNEQNDLKLEFAMKALGFLISNAIYNKSWDDTKYYRTLLQFCRWEYKEIWKRHNLLRGI